jgi:hypothetical protein
MAKIILNDGTIEYLTPGEARAKIAAGKASYPKQEPYYSTRQLVAGVPEKKTRKKKEVVAESVDDESEPV